MLSFYDRYLKGKQTDYDTRPNVEYEVRGSKLTRSSDVWPPKNVQYRSWYLNAESSGSVTSLNDGGLAATPTGSRATTSYRYPDPQWVAGVVGFAPGGPAAGYDPVRRVLTFNSAPLDADLEIAGPIKLVLFASSTATDTDFFVKISCQFPQDAEARAKGVNPAADLVSRGWLRASHRRMDEARSTEMEPYHTHTSPEAIVPGRVYRYDISVEPMAYLFKKGSRIRLEIVNGDSPITEGAYWAHYYRPNQIGEDTIHHSAEYPSALILPVTA